MSSKPSEERLRARFDELRGKYLAAKEKRDALDVEFGSRYGSGYQASWLKAGDRKAQERATAALNKVGDAMFEHVKSFSPRDWSHGVPAYWVRESLTFEDAARPLGEPLSVTPPLSYGSTRPKT